MAKIFLKLIIPLVLLAIIYSHIDFSRVGEFISWHILIIFLFALVLNIFNLLLSAKKLQLIVNSSLEFENRFSLGKTIKVYFSSAFFGLFLPTSFGGDAAKSVFLIQQCKSLTKKTAISAVILERISGLIALAVLLCFLPLFPQSLQILRSLTDRLSLSFSHFLLFGVLASVASVVFFYIVLKKKDTILHLAEKLFSSQFWPIWLISFVFQFIVIFNNFFVFSSISGQRDIIPFFFIIPFTLLVIILPISIQGIGIRDAIALSAFPLFFPTTSSTEIIIYTTLMNLLVLCTSAMGGLIYLFSNMTSSSVKDRPIKTSKKILVVNGINYWNIGDLGITDAMLSLFKQRFGDAKITILTPYLSWEKPNSAYLENSENEIGDIFLFPTKKELKSQLGRIVFSLNIFSKFIRFSIFLIFFTLLKIHLLFLFSKNERNAVIEYIGADVIVSKGGGFLFDHGRFYLSPHVLPIVFAIFLGKPVVIYAQSIGPFPRKISKWLYKQIFLRVQIIIVREHESFKILSDMGVKSIEGMDAAFTLLATSNNEERKNIDSKVALERGKRKILIGMSLVLWHFPYSEKDNREKLLKNYIDVLAKIVSTLEKEQNAYFYIFPHSIDGMESDDREAISRMLSLAKIPKESYEIVATQHNPRILSYFLSKLDFCIGTRMHSNIFALKANTPLVAISYLPKTKGIMSLFGLDEYVCNIDNLTFIELHTKLEKVIRDRLKIQKYLIEKNIEIERRARANAEFLAPYL
jgi:colanic acid/amylovoran biosynthesis protein